MDQNFGEFLLHSKFGIIIAGLIILLILLIAFIFVFDKVFFSICSALDVIALIFIFVIAHAAYNETDASAKKRDDLTEDSRLRQINKQLVVEQ